MPHHKFAHFTLPTFLRYSVVGASGTAIDFCVLILLVEALGIPPLPASIPAFLLAVINNYLLNRYWTYRNKESALIKQMAKFLAVSLVGLLINSSLMYLLLEIGLWYVLAKILIIGVVIIWNFSANSMWTFRKNASDN